MRLLTYETVRVATLLLCQAIATQSLETTFAHDATSGLRYHGLSEHGVDTFYGIPYGQDTSGANRFKLPKLYVPPKGSTIDATVAGPACPQPNGDSFKPLYLSYVTDVSEDCLHLNVYRPAGTSLNAKLPVFLYIHGGSFYVGSKDDIVIQPGGLIRKSVEIGIPMIYVSINYRLGVFGFAQNKALKDDRSENVGLRDPRLAIEWTRDNIASFGGDGKRITIGGQSSGGLAIGMQIMAYGSSRPVPFQQGSCESQALEPGLNGDFTMKAIQHVADMTGCNDTDLQSAATINCLRRLTMEQLNGAQIHTHHDGPSSNVGDQWLPVVDDDFLPDTPSKLIAQGKFANVTTMIGWCEDDGNFFVGNPTSQQDVFNLILPGIPPGLPDRQSPRAVVSVPNL